MRWRLAALCGSICLMLMACAAQGPSPKARGPAWQPATVAVMPFSVVRPGPGQDVVRCPITGAYFRPGVVAPGAEAAMDALMGRLAPRMLAPRVLDPARTRLAYQRVLGKAVGWPTRAQLAALGRRLGAQAVIVGFIYRFRERVGPPLAASRPAAVTFDLTAIRCSDARVMWHRAFDAVQQPLSQNILGLGRYLRYGFKWLTARELAEAGLREVLASCPWAAKGEKQ